MSFAGRRTCCILIALLGVCAAGAQSSVSNLVTTGRIMVDGRTFAYRVRHLPPASYPALPAVVAGELSRRGCLIPQTYQAHRPENVVHGSFERAGSSDWAVLCSVEGQTSLLVFFGAAQGAPMTVASAAETQRLQAYSGGTEMGFNWGIDPATPETVRDLQDGMWPRPAPLDHDALADSIIDQKTIYRYYANDKWTVAEMAP